MSLTIPFTFVAKTKAKASEVNANFAATAAKFSEGAGGINDTDVSSTADINANKLSSTANKRITVAKFEDDAVDGRVLKDDVSIGSPNAAVNLATHLKDRIIPKTKLSTTIGSKISNAEMDMLVEDTAIAPIGTTGLVITSVSLVRIVSGADYQVRVRVLDETGQLYIFTLVPTTAVPTASRNIVAIYASNFIITPGAPNTMTGSVTVASIAKA
jgi:hypothetical protein